MRVLFTFSVLLLSFTSYSQIAIAGNDSSPAGLENDYYYTQPLLQEGSLQWAVTPSGTATIQVIDQRTARIIFQSEGTNTISVQIFGPSGEPGGTYEKQVNVTSALSGSPWTEIDDEAYYIGNVGIGNTDPDYELDVTGTANISGDIIAARVVDASNSAYFVEPASTSKVNIVNANNFDVNPGNGRGLRFWNSNNYKIHMGSADENKYAHVQDYSIKNNMNNDPDRGWTWGVSGSTPIAAINTQGKMQIKNDFTSEGNIYATGGNSVNWNTAYSWDNHATQGYYRTGSNPSFGSITTNLTTFTNKERANGGNTKGSIYFDENYYGDYSAITGGNGGGLSILDEDGWGAIIATNNMKWITAEFDGLKIVGESNFNDAVYMGSTTTQSTTPILYVNGGSYFTDINVQALSTWWPDYVFSDDYKLRTLEETAKFIEENSHLPEVPSAKEIEEDGINVAEMNAILLKKIEELTLHMIEQNKQIKSLSDKVESLESKK